MKKLSDKEVMTRCILLAIDNGYRFNGGNKDFYIENGNIYFILGHGIDKPCSLEELIFNHDFCKALFGAESEGIEEHNGKIRKIPAWEYHIERLAVNEDRIDYLRNWLKEQS